MQKILLLTIVLGMVKPCLVLATSMLTLDIDSDSDIKCAGAIIKEFERRSLTLVNLNDDLKLAKTLHNTLKYKIITRRYLGTDMDIPNETYIILCKNTEDCIGGLHDLVKDRYWNPNATFCFIVITTTPQDIEKLFMSLHNLNVFKCVILNNGNVYLYNFDIGNHCEFTPQAILKYECNWIYKSDSYVLNGIRQSLKDFKKYQYTTCSLKMRIRVVRPYLVLKDNNTLVGFEDEFVKLIADNFENATLEYDTTGEVVGTVSENFTMTHSLRDIQNGVIDGVLGATVLSQTRTYAFDFTTPHILDDVILIVPKAVKVEKWIVMFTIFKPVIWLLICTVFFLIQILEFVARAGNALKDSQLLITQKLDMFGYFTNKGSKTSPRYIFTMWVLFTWYITVFYQSGLASVFTKPTFNHQINSIKELKGTDYTLYLKQGLKIFVQDSKELDQFSFVEKNIIEVCKDDMDCLNTVATGKKKYALSSRLVSTFYAPNFYDDYGVNKLHMLQDPYYHLLVTAYFRKGDPNLNRIRYLEGLVLSSGLNQRSMLRVIHTSRLLYRKPENLITPSLKCKDIAGLYYLLLSGSSLAVVSFLFEILKSRQKTF